MSAPSLPQGGVNIDHGEGKSFWLLTDLLTFKLTGEETNNAFTVLEVSAGPELGPPPHIHRHSDESFYILEGSFDFSLADQSFSAGAGSFVHLPKGVLHSHRAGGGAAAKALVIQSPSGVEQFVMEAGRPATMPLVRPGPPEPAEVGRVLAIAPNHGIDVPM